MASEVMNPAGFAAQHAMDQLVSCLEQKKSFVFEAGAGAGKTYSLIQGLHYLIKRKALEFQRNNQRIACITYTNVAKDEIKSRTNAHPLVVSETIHSFCWSLISNFQPQIRRLLASSEKWRDRIENGGSIKSKPIEYDLGYPKVEEERVSLSHDDVLNLMVQLMDEPKFRAIVSSRFPIIFIDEYQDTNKALVNAFLDHFMTSDNAPLIGFFGDSWQKIYGTEACGKLDHERLVFIGKKANFRSQGVIVNALNRMREELPQSCANMGTDGSVVVFHTNTWAGKRRTEAHWKGDLPPTVAHTYLETTIKLLSERGWDFSPDKTKTLMLTHNLLASEQGYLTLAEVFKGRNDALLKKEDAYISFLVDVVEPICEAFVNRRYGQISAILAGKMHYLKDYEDKGKWVEALTGLLKLRTSGTIGEVIEYLKAVQRPRLSPGVEREENNLQVAIALAEADRSEKQQELISRLAKMKAITYQEIISVSNFINEKTPFATKHGVKGAEFENVLVVFGRGWNQYNFDQMLTWARKGVPSDRKDTFDRNRNLFYVVCSRPKQRLALLFTQLLSQESINTLIGWFGSDSIFALPDA